MLEFYYDFLDRFISREDFELIQMDTDLMYVAVSGDSLDELVKPEMREIFEVEKPNWMVTNKFSERTSGLFKTEFQGDRMIAITPKCYYADGPKGRKISCKGVSKKQNEMSWERYGTALNGCVDMAKNTGFRIRNGGLVTYEQTKLGLSAYYDKRIVLEDGIHTAPLKKME